MTYNEYLKNKIINLYEINEINKKIGTHSIKTEDFKFLDSSFEFFPKLNKNIYSVSELLQNIISNM